MRTESSFFEKSSVRLILTRARGLRILTFDKIKKKAFAHKFTKYDSIYRNTMSFCQNRAYPYKTNSKNFLWDFNSMTNKTPNTDACSENSSTEQG